MRNSNKTRRSSNLYNVLHSRRNSSTPRWHTLGTRGDKRDPAALEFARLGLLASRW